MTGAVQESRVSTQEERERFAATVAWYEAKIQQTLDEIEREERERRQRWW